MQTSWSKLLAMLTLCGASTLCACVMDDGNASDDPDVSSNHAAATAHTADRLTGEGQYMMAMANAISDDLVISSKGATETTHTTDPLTGEGQYTIAMANGISINLSVRQWQTDFNGWNERVNFFCGAQLAVDGGFGTRTTAATVCFQNGHGLQANGDVGRITLGAMCAGLTFVNRIDLRNNTNCMQ